MHYVCAVLVMYTCSMSLQQNHRVGLLDIPLTKQCASAAAVVGRTHLTCRHAYKHFNELTQPIVSLTRASSVDARGARSCRAARASKQWRPGPAQLPRALHEDNSIEYVVADARRARRVGDAGSPGRRRFFGAIAHLRFPDKYVGHAECVYASV